MVYSGTLSMGNATTGQSIRLEEGGPTTNISLRSLSSVAGKSTPDAMSEFYGYTHRKITFNSGFPTLGSSTSSSGTLTIQGGSYTFSAMATPYGAWTISTSITINGNTRSISSSSGTKYSTTSFVLAAGTYNYSVTCTMGGSGSGGIYYV